VFLLRLAVRSFNLKVETGSEGMIGEIGTAKTEVAEAGQVFVHGELWSAYSRHPIAAGTMVRVAELEGLKMRVEPADSPGENGSA
jgi:membrane-bound serine protease (ClpP class)